MNIKEHFLKILFNKYKNKNKNLTDNHNQKTKQ